MKFSTTATITMLAALAAVEAKNPAKARAAQEARARSAVKKAAARGIETPKHIQQLMRSLGIDERKICDAACEQRREEKAAAKQAKKEAKAAAKAAKAAAKQAAKEAKAAKKAEAQAAKAAKKEAAAAAKAAKKAEEQAKKDAAKAAANAAREEAAAQKAAEKAAKAERQKNKSLKSWKLDRYNDYCVSADDYVLWEPYGEVQTWDFDSAGTMVDSTSGYLTVTKPDSANNHAGWYLLVKAKSGSDMKEIYLADDDYVSVPGAYHRISGFEDWCEVEEAGSGSGAGSGAGSDELVAVNSRQFEGEVTITVGSSDPNEYTWFYCYQTNKGEADC